MKKVGLVVLGLILVLSTSQAIASTPDWVLQNKKVTPGVLNKDVTQENISTTICKS